MVMFVAELLHALADRSVVDMAGDTVVVKGDYEVDIPLFYVFFKRLFDDGIIPPLPGIIL